MVTWVGIKPASSTRPGSRLNPKQKISNSASAGNDPETKINLAPYAKQVSLKKCLGILIGLNWFLVWFW